LASLRETVLNRWSKLSSGNAYSEEVAQRADRFLQWAKQDEHQHFLDWLFEKGDEPVPIGNDHSHLIAGTARSNTFKEIRHYLMDQEKKASAVLDREQHG
jgi:hypothetical protein